MLKKIEHNELFIIYSVMILLFVLGAIFAVFNNYLLGYLLVVILAFNIMILTLVLTAMSLFIYDKTLVSLNKRREV